MNSQAGERSVCSLNVTSPPRRWSVPFPVTRKPPLVATISYSSVPVSYSPDPYPYYWSPAATFFAGAVTGAVWAAAVDGQPMWDTTLTPKDNSSAVSPFVVLSDAS